MEQLESQTNSWQFEFRDSIKSLKELSIFLETDVPETHYPIFIPKHFAQKIKSLGPNSSLWKQFVPQRNESDPHGFSDPIGDEVHAKKNGIIHRYKNRVLFNPTTICPINCRYCFRKNELFSSPDFLKANLDKLSEYLINTPEVEEVILTGGDPLILSTPKIDLILKRLSEIKTIKYIRFHSRTPIILPKRLDLELSELLKRYAKIFETLSLAIHVNHSEELSMDLFSRLLNLHGVNLLSQTVLLKGINNNEAILSELFKDLNSFGIRPYYLHHPDQVKGAMHFHLSLEDGRKIYGRLRDMLPGWLIPHYVVDSPEGIGKALAYNSEHISYQGQLLDRFNQSHRINL